MVYVLLYIFPPTDAKLRTTIRPLLLFPRSKEFFIYEGSLTSPPCSESVLWVVMRQPLQLSSRRVCHGTSAYRWRWSVFDVYSIHVETRSFLYRNQEMINETFPLDVPYTKPWLLRHITGLRILCKYISRGNMEQYYRFCCMYTWDEIPAFSNFQAV